MVLGEAHAPAVAQFAAKSCTLAGGRRPLPCAVTGEHNLHEQCRSIGLTEIVPFHRSYRNRPPTPRLDTRLSQHGIGRLLLQTNHMLIWQKVAPLRAAAHLHGSYRDRAVPSVLQKSPANPETRHPALPTRDRAPSPSDQPHVDLDVAPTELRTIGTSDPVYRGHEAVGLALFRACLPPRLPAAPAAFHR